MHPLGPIRNESVVVAAAWAYAHSKTAGPHCSQRLEIVHASGTLDFYFLEFLDFLDFDCTRSSRVGRSVDQSSAMLSPSETMIET